MMLRLVAAAAIAAVCTNAYGPPSGWWLSSYQNNLEMIQATKYGVIGCSWRGCLNGKQLAQNGCVTSGIPASLGQCAYTNYSTAESKCLADHNCMGFWYTTTGQYKGYYWMRGYGGEVIQKSYIYGNARYWKKKLPYGASCKYACENFPGSCQWCPKDKHCMNGSCTSYKMPKGKCCKQGSSNGMGCDGVEGGWGSYQCI